MSRICAMVLLSAAEIFHGTDPVTYVFMLMFYGSLISCVTVRPHRYFEDQVEIRIHPPFEPPE